MRTLQFRINGTRLSLAEEGDVLKAGQRILAGIEVTVEQLSALFTDDDARRDVLLLFTQAYRPNPDAGVLETEFFHEVVAALRLPIMGAGMGASVLGEQHTERSS